MELKDEDIKKALECCVKCPARKYKGCDYTLHKNALDLINRQQAEIEKFKRAIKEADQHFSEGAFNCGVAIIARLAIELEKGGERDG